MKLIYLTILILVLFGCKKINVEETLPDITNISPTNMQSNLDRIDILADSEDLTHMYTNYLSDIQIPAEIKYYGSNGILIFSQEAFIEIRGAGSAANPMKSIGIVFSEKINNSSYQIIETSQALPGDDLSQLQSIRLRNSGNDDGITHLKDLALTELAIRNSIDLELKYGKAIQVYLNTKYFGLLNMRTENDVMALSDLLNVNIDDITMMKMDFPETDLDYREGNKEVAQSLIDAIENEDGYELNQLIDIDNFIDYILFEDYVGNTDWPHNNAKLYSINGGKFRFLLFDLDWGLDRNRTQRLPKMEYLEDDISLMYQVLREYDHGFIEALENRQKELYELLSSTKFEAIIYDLSNQIDSEIGYLIQRWGPPHSTLEWRLNLSQLQQDFEVNEFYSRKIYGLF
ncbi:MAG: CotH kinase family protein [Crocinitomicaceae bacterium]|nr:CotH kinase family protein [Crocinitomicaceae bacterium]